MNSNITTQLHESDEKTINTQELIDRLDLQEDIKKYLTLDHRHLPTYDNGFSYELTQKQSHDFVFLCSPSLKFYRNKSYLDEIWK